VAKLIAQSACDGLLPVTVGTVTLTEVVPEDGWIVAPFKGQEKAVSKVLTEACGVGFPAANRMLAKAGARAQWVGASRALVSGAALPDLSGLAAVTAQADGLAVVSIEGDGAEAVLARLVPVDLRAAVFKRGHTARTLINHMSGSVTRTGAATFEVAVMRSMARTLVHELTEAAEGVAARD